MKKFGERRFVYGRLSTRLHLGIVVPPTESGGLQYFMVHRSLYPYTG